MAFGAEARQQMIFGPAAGGAERLGQVLRQARREVAVVRRVEPQRRDARRAAETTRSRDQTLRRAVVVRLVVGTPAAPAREIDDRLDAARSLAGVSDGAPSACGLSRDDDAGAPDEFLRRHVGD